MQYYGECWSAPITDQEYDKHGKADTCQNNKYEPYTNRTSCVPGTGLKTTNYVYRIATSGKNFIRYT